MNEGRRERGRRKGECRKAGIKKGKNEAYI
jgi:hypothetical protein